MGETKRRIQIIVEKHRLVILKGRNAAVDSWCEMCGEQVRMVTPDQAALISDVSSRTIYRWVETGRVHFIETAEGFSLICLHSLESYEARRDSTQAGQEEDVGQASQILVKKSLVRRILRRR